VDPMEVEALCQGGHEGGAGVDPSAVGDIVGKAQVCI
jgi:hypothetical protein